MTLHKESPNTISVSNMCTNYITLFHLDIEKYHIKTECTQYFNYQKSEYPMLTGTNYNGSLKATEYTPQH